MRVYTGHADTGFELGCLGLSVLIPGYGLALKPWDRWIGSNTHPQTGAPGLKGLKMGWEEVWQTCMSPHRPGDWFSVERWSPQPADIWLLGVHSCSCLEMSRPIP